MTRAAIENLRACQRQLDMDGCEVGVSRQAVDETLTALDYAVAMLKVIATGKAGADAPTLAQAALDLVELGERACAEMRGDLDPETLCSDCAPVGYLTDATRCAPCPRPKESPR